LRKNLAKPYFLKLQKIIIMNFFNLALESWILIVIAIVILSKLFWESVSHNLNLKRIPIRVHVNGTRGKSSVTRLIAAGLRAGGIITCAKTTGTLPRFIRPDGSEEAIFRPTRANILEQISIFKKAASYHPQALIIECMAVQPLLQSLSELKIVQSTHGIIINAREDHLDVMGPAEIDVAYALAGTVPVKGLLYTAERRHLEVLRLAAVDRETQLHAIDEMAVAAIDDASMARFSYQEHKENVALALTICENLGVSRQVALQGMWKARPDPGAMTISEIDWGLHRLIFVNAFAANDPYSTERIWREMLNKYPECKCRIALMNCRADRRHRTLQMAETFSASESADQYIAIGTGAKDFIRSALDYNISSIKLIDAGELTAEQLFEELVNTDNLSPALSSNPLPSLIVGMGNIAGIGFEIVEYFRNHHNLKE
jgi:poly-gamma-glutamate synthase PgsB/CapB